MDHVADAVRRMIEPPGNVHATPITSAMSQAY